MEQRHEFILIYSDENVLDKNTSANIKKSEAKTIVCSMESRVDMEGLPRADENVNKILYYFQRT